MKSTETMRITVLRDDSSLRHSSSKDVLIQTILRLKHAHSCVAFFHAFATSELWVIILQNCIEITMIYQNFQSET